MFPKTIKSVDFNGNEREQTYYFNLTEAELVKLQASMDGGLTEYAKKIMETQDIPKLMALFEQLILASYGEKSPDGSRFIKVDPVRGRLADEFAQTNAYSDMFMEFLDNPQVGIDFFNSVIPAKFHDNPEAGKPYPPSIEKT